MSYSLMETVRRACVNHASVHALVEDRIFPMDNKMAERLESGKFPLVTFTILDNDDYPCGKIITLFQLDVIHRGLEKKTLWDVHRALEQAVDARLLQAASEQAPDLLIRVALFRQTNAEDDLFDEATNTHRLRSQWRVIYIRKPS